MQKSALLLILLAIVLGLAADDYFIGEGTSTQNKVPVYGYSNYGWSKFFYTPAETAAAGVTGTIQITGLAFEVSTSISDYVMDNQQIYMTHFYDSSYASTGVSYPNNATYNNVFTGSLTFDGPGWVQIQFTTPFSYNSSYGFEILWENHDGTKLGGPPSFYYQSQSYSSVYKTSDTSFPAVSGTRSSYHPNIWIMTPPTDVPPPAACVSPADGGSGIDVNASLVWNNQGGAPDHYRLWFGTDNPPSNIVQAYQTTSSSYTPAQYLDYGTTYYWRVVPHNDFGYALDCPVWSFTTMADPTIYNFPWSESFDGTFNPAGWTDHQGDLIDPVVLNPDGSSMWEQDDWLNIASTDKAAKLELYSSIRGWLISPRLNISDNHVLTFDATFLKWNQPPEGTPPDPAGVDDRFAVLIGDGYFWSTADILREWNNTGSPDVLNAIPVNGATFSIPLAGHSGRRRIAFYAGSTVMNADNDFMLNNVWVGEAGLATPEADISIDYVLDELTLSWNAVAGASSYKIYKAPAPEGEFTLLDTTSDTQYQIQPADALAFFRIVAVN